MMPLRSLPGMHFNDLATLAKQAHRTTPVPNLGWDIGGQFHDYWRQAYSPYPLTLPSPLSPGTHPKGKASVHRGRVAESPGSQHGPQG